MKEKEMTTNEVVGELTEQEIVAGAFNVVKRSLLEKLQDEEKSDNILKILGLTKEGYRGKFTSGFLYGCIMKTESYTEMWKMILEKCDSMEEFTMAMHTVYQTKADIDEKIAGIKDPMKDLLTALQRMGK